MRHSPARRSLLSQLGKTVQLTDRVGQRPRHGGPLALPAHRTHAHRARAHRPQAQRALRLAALVGGACAGFCLVLALVALVVMLSGAGE